MSAARSPGWRRGQRRLAALGAIVTALLVACSAGGSGSATPGSTSIPGPSVGFSSPASSPPPSSTPSTAGSPAGPAGTTSSALACLPPAAPVQRTLVLDYLPNAVHAPIYTALAKGYYRDAGIDLRIETPTSTSDTIRLMAAGKADFGIASILDLLTAYGEDPSIEIFGSVVQSPLAAVVGFEKSGIARPRDLEGRLVGVTGVPSDLAALDSIVRYDGGDPSKVRTVTIGFNAVQNVVSGAVDAAIGFWSAEGVQLASLAPAFTFRLDRYGAPTYPELVYFAKKDLVARDPCAVRAFLGATARGYADTKADPDAALRALADGAEGLVLTDAKAQLDALMPVFQGDAPAYGHVSMPVLQEYLSWARQAGILDLTAAPSEFATDALGSAP